MRCGLLLALLLSGCADRSPNEALSARSSAVFGGAEDSHDAVVAILVGPLDAPTNVCSGVVVSARVVVTAAHCVFGASEVRVRVGARMKTPTQTSEIVAISPYPGYSPGTERDGLDIAIVRTGDDLGVTPIPLASDPDDLAIGSAIDVVGYGRSNRLDPGSIGVRQRARVTVTALCDRLFASGDDTQGVCAGDPGGAVLAPTTGALVGMIGFGVRAACAPPGWSIRIAPYAKWISSFIDGRDDMTCATCPAASKCEALQDTPDAGAEPIDAASPPQATEEHGGCSAAAVAFRAANESERANRTLFRPSRSRSRLGWIERFGWVGVLLSVLVRRRSAAQR